MKFTTATLLTTLLSFISGLYLPWWAIALVSLVIAAIIHQKPKKAFFSGFLGVFLLWAGLAWWIDLKNNSVLSPKIASILQLGENPYLLILGTGLVGGLVGGFAALTGSYLRNSPKPS